jgi:hypothetical protein
MYNQFIGSCYGQKWQQRGHRLMLRMSVHGASTIFCFASWIIYVPISCRHPFHRNWQPLLGKSTELCSLPHAENEHQMSVNNLPLCILGSLYSKWLQTSIIRYWQPLLAKRNVTCSLPHPENECHRNINSFSSCIFGNQGVVQNIGFLTEILTTVIGKNTIHQRYHTNSKFIHLARLNAGEIVSSVVENTILKRYY